MKLVVQWYSPCCVLCIGQKWNYMKTLYILQIDNVLNYKSHTVCQLTTAFQKTCSFYRDFSCMQPITHKPNCRDMPVFRTYHDFRKFAQKVLYNSMGKNMMICDIQCIFLKSISSKRLSFVLLYIYICMNSGIRQGSTRGYDRNG